MACSQSLGPSAQADLHHARDALRLSRDLPCWPATLLTETVISVDHDSPQNTSAGGSACVFITIHARQLQYFADKTRRGRRRRSGGVSVGLRTRPHHSLLLLRGEF